MLLERLGPNLHELDLPLADVLDRIVTALHAFWRLDAGDGRCKLVDPEAVWQRGYVERVATGLLNLRDFAGDDGLAFLAVAARSR